MTYLYLPAGRDGKVVLVDLFRGGHWRGLALMHLLLVTPIWSLILGCMALEAFLFPRPKAGIGRLTFGLLDLPLKSARHVCLTPGKWKQPLLSQIWWTMYSMLYPMDVFEEDYLQAWHDKLWLEGPVVWVNIFTDKDSFCVPILFDRTEQHIGNDRQTFEALRTWYCLIRAKRGLSEIILPRRLTQIDKVGLCNGVKGTVRLGSRLKVLELGRSGSSHVANFEQPWKISEEQRFQTEAIVASADTEGLEFIGSWDSVAVSVISLMPFVLSLVFAGVWIGVSVQQYAVDAQVATQTAFTVAAYIVTAGALLIALFAFLDSQAQIGQ